MITKDTTLIFPGCPSFGFTVQPNFLVKITDREGGFERRDGKWKAPLRLYEAVPTGNRPEADIYRIYKFSLLAGATLRGFRFKDWLDFKSGDLSDSITPLDQPFEFIPGSPGGYQLMKTYADADTGLEYDRVIFKPVGATIRVANHLGVEQDASRWTIEEGTGLLTIGGGFVGTPTSWGGEFYVWCRFMEAPKVEFINYKVNSITAVIKELRQENT